jgi:hypothetical protein
MSTVITEDMRMTTSGREAGRHGKQEHDLQRDGGGKGHVAERSKKDLDKELDKSLMDSFPSSDPPALSQPTGSEPAGDPKVKP